MKKTLLNFIEAKAAFDTAKAAFAKAEKKLIDSMPSVEVGKSKTFEQDGCKITIRSPQITKLDAQAWESIADKFPRQLQPVRVKYDVDAAGVKYIMDKEPALFNLFQTAMTTKPGKQSAKVEKGI